MSGRDPAGDFTSAGGDGDEPLDAWILPSGGPEPHGFGSVEVGPAAVPARFPTWESGALPELAETLRGGRDRVLEEMPVEEVAAALGAVGTRLLRDGDDLRARALSLLPTYSGVSPSMAREILDGMARDWTEERLRRLLRVELGDPTVLDEFQPDPRLSPTDHPNEGRWVRAVGPELSLHVCASTVPGVSVTSLVRGLLVKSAVVLKPGRSDLVLPLLFAEGLREEAPALAQCVAVLYWPGGSRAQEEALLQEADAVVAYGSDEAVRDLRDRTPVTRTFIAYRHRVGAALVGREGLRDRDVGKVTARRVARAVAAFDQRGCVSPHVVFVEEGASLDSAEWTELLADSLQALEKELPSGPLTASEASAIQQLRGTWEMRAAAGDGARIRHGGRDPWTVLHEPESGFALSCAGRVIRVRPVKRLEEAVAELRPVGRHLQTVSLEGTEGRRQAMLAESLARSGAVRITTAPRSPWPPPWWHHDGAGPLRSLVRWVDLEGL